MSNVTDMREMFYKTHTFNQDISGWDVSKVTDFVSYGLDSGHPESLFTDSNKYYFPSTHVTLTNSNIQTAINDWMDNGSNKYKYGFNITNWDVSNVTSFYKFLRNTNYEDTFNEDISGWDVSNVINMEQMFKDATNFNQDISSWNVSKVTNMASMFYSASFFQSTTQQLGCIDCYKYEPNVLF